MVIVAPSSSSTRSCTGCGASVSVLRTGTDAGMGSANNPDACATAGGAAASSISMPASPPCIAAASDRMREIDDPLQRLDALGLLLPRFQRD